MTNEARDASKKAKRFIQNETPNMPQMSSSGAEKDEKPEGGGEEPAAPPEPEPDAAEKKSEEKKTAKEPLPEEVRVSINSII